MRKALLLSILYATFNSVNAQDLTIQVNAPMDDCALDIGSTVTVTVINVGASPSVGNVDLSYSLNGGPFVTEGLISMVVPASGSYIYYFTNPVDLSSCQTHELVVAVSGASNIVTTNDTLTVDIISHCHPIIDDVAITHTIGSDGSLSCTVSGGTPAYTYEWVNLTTFASVNTSSWTSLAPDDYELIVEDNNGCLADSTVTLLNILSTTDSEQPTIKIEYSNQILSISSAQANTILHVFDVNGRLIENRLLTNETENIGTNLAEGIYYYSITSPSDELVQTGKFLVAR